MPLSRKTFLNWKKKRDLSCVRSKELYQHLLTLKEMGFIMPLSREPVSQRSYTEQNVTYHASVPRNCVRTFLTKQYGILTLTIAHFIEVTLCSLHSFLSIVMWSHWPH
jgi:hypothetical protein